MALPIGSVGTPLALEVDIGTAPRGRIGWVLLILGPKALVQCPRLDRRPIDAAVRIRDQILPLGQPLYALEKYGNLDQQRPQQTSERDRGMAAHRQGLQKQKGSTCFYCPNSAATGPGSFNGLVDHNSWRPPELESNPPGPTLTYHTPAAGTPNENVSPRPYFARPESSRI